MNEFLVPNAGPYAARYQLEFAEPLGSGKDGIVLVARYWAKSADVAIKIFRFDDAYTREKQTYQRLERFSVTRYWALMCRNCSDLTMNCGCWK